MDFVDPSVEVWGGGRLDLAGKGGNLLFKGGEALFKLDEVHWEGSESGALLYVRDEGGPDVCQGTLGGEQPCGCGHPEILAANIIRTLMKQTVPSCVRVIGEPPDHRKPNIT